MAVTITRISRWIWGRKDRETPNLSTSSSLDFSSGFRESEQLKFPQAGEHKRSSMRRLWGKWKSREEQRVDKEHDIVLVPPDGGCLSGSESDDSDWSIGWSEPHDPEFLNANEPENSFAALVPCYRRRRPDHRGKGSESPPFGLVRPDDDAQDDRKRVDGWLSSF